MACSKGTCITLYGTTYFQNYFVIECSYLLKTVSTIKLMFCGRILQNIIIRKKKEWASSSGPLGHSKVTPFYESELEELWEFTGGGITVGSDSWQRLLGKIWSQSL